MFIERVASKTAALIVWIRQPHYLWSGRWGRLTSCDRPRSSRRILRSTRASSNTVFNNFITSSFPLGQGEDSSHGMQEATVSHLLTTREILPQTSKGKTADYSTYSGNRLIRRTSAQKGFFTSEFLWEKLNFPAALSTTKTMIHAMRMKTCYHSLNGKDNHLCHKRHTF